MLTPLVIYGLFFLSGVSSLILETVWTRLLGTVFGNTVYAASTVLTAFMLGLALGSALIGRLADRSKTPLAWYGYMEIGVGIYAFLFPALMIALTPFYQWFFRAFDPSFPVMSGVRFILSILLILPPAMLMGGTLPAVGRVLGFNTQTPSTRIGVLYGINTLGAVAGTFCAGFILMERYGVQETLFIAAGLALGVGLLTLTLASFLSNPSQKTGKPLTKIQKKKTRKKAKSFTPPPVNENEAPSTPIDPSLYWLVVIVFGIAGFCSLAYEVLWTRILIYIMTTSIYAFSTMLTVFLAGIGLGSFLASQWLTPKINRPLVWFGLVEVLLGFSVLVSMDMLRWPFVMDYRTVQAWFGMSSERWIVNTAHFINAIVIMFIPALLKGVAFPLVAKICVQQKEHLAWNTGQIYAANTIGSVLGAFAAGFLLIPIMGIQRSMLLLVFLNIAIGLVILWRSLPSAGLMRLGYLIPAAGVYCIFAAVFPANAFEKAMNYRFRPAEIAYVNEHPTGTVVVHDYPYGERLISVDSVTVAGMDFMLRTTQKLQGYIPFLLHPDPQKVVQIGFGSGETSRVGLEFGIPNYTVVDICPAVFEAGRFFEAINHGSYKNPRLNKVIMDGKNFALLSDQQYDIVMNDSIYPGSRGSSALYTYNHFLNCRKRLNEGGLFSCWIPIDLRLNELRMILKSFQQVFPHTSLWVASNSLNKHGLILGSMQPFEFDLQRLKQAMNRPHIKKDLQAIEIHNVYDLLDCMVMDENAVRAFSQQAPLNTDNHPRLEFSSAIKGNWQQKLTLVLSKLVVHHASIMPYLRQKTLTEEDKQKLTQRYQATNHIFQAQVYHLLRDPKKRQAHYDRAGQANPDEAHVKSNQDELRREIQNYHSILELHPNSPDVLEALAERYYLSLNYQKAQELYQQAIQLNAGLPDKAYVHLAEIQFNQGQTEKAKHTLRQCLEIWPRSPEAHDKLAGIYLKEDNFTMARRHIEQAAALDPSSPIYQQHRQAIINASK